MSEEVSGAEEEAEELGKIGCLCAVHLGEVVSFFCDDCRKACCALCCMRSHHGHQKRHLFEDGGDGLFGHTRIFFPANFTVGGLLKRLDEDIQQIELDAPDTSVKLRDCFETHKTSLEAQKKELIDHVNAVKKARLRFLQSQQKNLQKTFEDLKSSLEYTEKFLTSDDDLGLLSAEKEITRRLAELDEKCCKIDLPTEEDWNLDKIKVIRDGKYVEVNSKSKPPSQPTRKSIHDSTFKATAVKLSFSIDPDMFKAFVHTCCVELGEKYWLKAS